jgi:hypothetical protein
MRRFDPDLVHSEITEQVIGAFYQVHHDSVSATPNLSTDPQWNAR